ncbi:TetR family transcriptional regulator [Tamilnaduibacter salinus]|uniref:TetR family transcriptional regulator n=1 Tax=Tamilnaduibacter salinus TaxID=1484056 RepID=A0A2A2I5G0_9GAMM|nr:TetR/AcrR family transcriptional regulator [Tamilnaduibacter salinus]PAV26969.1 TetR family transcriptional regulator [Tamilnaduibacter salinus]PVY78374.1 TetR family transcriptional regulator [Tamilnaduibacter salinus]
MSEQNDLAPRRRPVQARSRERVEAILSHAASMITEKGVDGVSMSAIARSSEMSLASLYRYFPNKSAIVCALAEDHVERMEQAMREQLHRLTPADVVDTLIDLYYDFYCNEPAYRAIWTGVESMPELQALDLRELHTNARDLYEWLTHHFPDSPEDRRWSASLMVPRAAGTILRLAMTLPESEADRLLSELKRMIHQYLATVSDP